MYIVGDDDIRSGFRYPHIEGRFSRQLGLLEVFGNIQQARNSICNRWRGEVGDPWHSLLDSSPNGRTSLFSNSNEQELVLYYQALVYYSYLFPKIACIGDEASKPHYILHHLA